LTLIEVLGCLWQGDAYCGLMSAPSLLLVHGYPFDHTLWDAVIPLLDKEIQVLAPDLRGFGGQPAGADEPSLERMADDLTQLLVQRQIGQAVVAGMSMGGYVALAFAERQGPRLSGLGLISSHVWADSDDARAARRAMIERIRREGPAVAAQAAIPKLFVPENIHRPEYTRFPVASVEKAGVAGLTWALEAMARRPDRSGVFKSLQTPILVVHGWRDQFIAADRAKEMASLSAHARYVEIPEAGHATPIEAPRPVAEALNDLVRRSGFG
jgi:pimeloyl-ACP methyl ester carboxylesterase